MDKTDVVTISRHGLKFMKTLDKMINHTGAGEDEKLVEIIHQVFKSWKEYKLRNKYLDL